MANVQTNKPTVPNKASDDLKDEAMLVDGEIKNNNNQNRAKKNEVEDFQNHLEVATNGENAKEIVAT